MGNKKRKPTKRIMWLGQDTAGKLNLLAGYYRWQIVQSGLKPVKFVEAK